MTINVGSVAVDVVPDARRFRPELEAQLRDLPTINIKVDTGEAEAKLTALRVQLDTLRDKSVRVSDNGTADRTSASIRGIKDAADTSALGVAARAAVIVAALAAIIPVAGAAAIAIAGIGFGAGLGILGALVGKLALGGVGAANKAASTQAAGGGTSDAQRSEQVASAVNGQRQAEVGLASAQRDATEAQQALTQARVDAVNNLQDLNNQVTDNALAQQQAVLDLETAQRNLATAQANPDAANPANSQALAQVQLTYAAAKQNLSELSEKGQLLANQQATANKAGVDGAANVVQAQNHVIDSQNALKEAQFQVADSARQVALAQASAAGGASAYQVALNKLNPAQRQFALFLQSIKPQLDILKNSAASSFLPLLQVAIQNLLPLIGPVSQLLGTVGKGFGDLAVAASKALTGPFWTQFLTFLNTILGPAIQTFGSIFGSLFTIAASAFQQAYPLIKSFGDALSGALGGAAKGVQGGALAGVFSFIKENLPQLKETLKTVADAIGSIFQSLAPLAGPALKAISDLARDLAAIAKVVAPVLKVLLPFAPAILGMVAAFKLLLPLVTAFNGLLLIFDAEADANPVGAITLAVAALVIGITELILHFKQVTDFLGGTWGTVIAGAIAVVFPFIGIPLLILGHWQQLKSFFVDLWKGISGTVSTGIDDVIGDIKALPGKIAGLAGDMASAGERFIKGLGDGILQGFTSLGGDALGFAKDFVNDLIQFVNDNLIDPLKHIYIGTGIPGVPKLHPFDLLPHIRQFALGGSLGAGQLGIVGENGPELVAPQHGIDIFSNHDSAKILRGIAAGQRGHGSRGDINQTFNLPLTDPVAIGYAVERRLRFAGV